MIFSIDGHELTVIEADGVLVEPVTVHRLSIAPGQRYSVLVSAPSTSGSTSPSPHDKSSWWRNLGARLLPRRVIDSPPYALGPSDSEERRKTQTFWMRAELHQACFNYPNAALDPVIKAIVSYDSSADRSSQNPLSPQRTPSTTPWTPGLDFAPCRDLDPAMLTPLEYTPAPELHLGKGDFRTVVFASNPKLEKHGLVPMGYMNRYVLAARSRVSPSVFSSACCIRDTLGSQYDLAS